jgi:hypothetical protein
VAVAVAVDPKVEVAAQVLLFSVTHRLLQLQSVLGLQARQQQTAATK